MLRAGFRVPDGFVITTQLYAQALAAGALDHHAAGESAFRASEAGHALCAALTEAATGAAYAVRSSATLEDSAGASMAGQFETCLHRTTRDDLLAAVHACWASARSERVAAYLQQKRPAAGPPAGDVQMAVVVQQMVDAAVAGVLFTIDPASGPQNMAIDASWGVGEAVVCGRVQPDHFVLERSSGQLVGTHLGTKELRLASTGEIPTTPAERAQACLTPAMLAELHALGLKIDQHFGPGQDVEWAFDAGGTLYCLQVRPITTPSMATAGDPAAARLIAETSARLAAHLKQHPHAAWARHNLGETLPHPTPLTWSTLQLDAPGGALARLNHLAGYQDQRRPVPLQLIAGRIYFDLERAPAALFADLPFRYDIPRLKHHPEEAQNPPTLPTGSFRQRLRGNRHIARLARDLRVRAQTLDQELDGLRFPEFRTWVARQAAADPAGLSPDAWIACWQERRDLIHDFAAWSLLPTMILALALDDLRTFLAEHFWDDDPAALAAQLAAPVAPDATLRQNIGLFQLAHGNLTLDQLLAEFGHRGPGELDLAAPRWREMPDAVTRLAASLKSGADPAAIHRQQVEAAQQTRTRLGQSLSGKIAQALHAKITLAQRYARFREDGKHEWMRGMALLRAMLLDASGRLATPPEELALLTEDQLFEALRTGRVPTECIGEQKALRTAQTALQLPDVITAEDLSTLGQPAPAPPPAPADIPRLAACLLAPGVATGPARIVLSPQDAPLMAPGYVLICPSTDPSWTPLFINAAAIILERGGALSHGAIVARELGKPAVVLAGATTLFTPGETLSVNASAGEILRTGVPSSAAPTDSPRAAPEADLPRNRPPAAETTADPNNDRLPAAITPPPAGSFERAANRAAHWGFLLWGVFLGLLWLVPQLQLREGSIGCFDLLLWPLIRSLGRPGAVMVLSAAMAFLTMLAQLLMTDTRRLREVKKRAAALRVLGNTLPMHSPREEAIHLAATAAQMRIARAGFVPLGILLGPMIVSFLWLPARVDPANINPAPGQNVTLTAWLDGEYTGPVRLEGAATPADAVEMPPLRQTLTELRQALAQPGELSPLIAAKLQASGDTREKMRQELASFLAHPIPHQAATWNLSLPTPGVQHLTLHAGKATLPLTLAWDDAAPPPLHTQPQPNGFSWELPGTGAIDSLTLTAADKRAPADRAFWRPFAWAGWDWDAGWLGLYLVVYLPAMFAARRLLRVP